MTASSKSLNLETWLRQAASDLQANAIQSSHLDAELLACQVLKQSRTWLHAHGEYQLSTTEHQKLDSLLTRRLQHEPLAYIIGSKEFFGRTFMVNPAVLVPRPESETIILLVKQLEEYLSCCDIGTGSGSLAISAQLEQPSWTVRATDISPEALEVARRNAQSLNAPEVVFATQNLLANDQNHYDVLLANLPYVPQKLFNKSDIAHEPSIALFAGRDGLDVYRQLFAQLGERKQKPTHLFTESLFDQHAAMQDLAAQAGYQLQQTQDLIQHFRLRH